MTTSPISPFTPHLLSDNLVPMQVDRYVRYYDDPHGLLPLEGRTQADVKGFYRVIDQLRTSAQFYGLDASLGVPVRVEIFTEKLNEQQRSATLWDWKGNMIIQIIEINRVGALLLDYLGINQEIREEALASEESIIIFYDEQTHPTAPTWRLWVAEEFKE